MSYNSIQAICPPQDRSGGLQGMQCDAAASWTESFACANSTDFGVWGLSTCVFFNTHEITRDQRTSLVASIGFDKRWAIDACACLSIYILTGMLLHPTVHETMPKIIRAYMVTKQFCTWYGIGKSQLVVPTAGTGRASIESTSSTSKLPFGPAAKAIAAAVSHGEPWFDLAWVFLVDPNLWSAKIEPLNVEKML